MRAGKYFDQILGVQKPLVDNLAEIAVKNYILNHDENKSEIKIMDRMKSALHFEMWEYLNSHTNSSIQPTGEFLNKLLEIYQITKTKFAEYVEIERTNLQAIIKGNRKFNSLLAKKIEKIFEIPAELWLHIETKNDLAKFDDKKINSKRKYSLKKLIHAR